MADLFTLPEFAKTIKSINPTASDQDIQKAWQVKAPELENINPAQAMKETMDIAKQMSSGTLKPVDVTAARPTNLTPVEDPRTAETTVPSAVDIPTTAPNPYKGTAQERINPAAPGAAGLSTFEDSELGRQLAQHAKNLQELHAQSRISDIGNAISSGIRGNASPYEAEQKYLAGQADLSKALTYGPLEARQAAAKGAEDLAGKMAERERAGGEFTKSQALGQQELTKARQANISGAMKVEDEQAYRDPKSVQSSVARSMLKSQAGFKELPPDVQQGINNQTISANQLINSGFIDPNFLSAYRKVTDIAKVEAETAKTGAETGGLLQSQKAYEAKSGIAAPSVYSLTSGGQPAPKLSTFGQPSEPAAAEPTVTSKSKYAGDVTATAQKYGVDPNLALHILNKETGGHKDPANAVGPETKYGRAVGVMQLLPSTAADYGLKPEDLTDPAKNIDASMQHLSRLSQKYNGDKLAIAAAYNWGEGAYDKWVANGRKFDQVPQQTRNYIAGLTPRAAAETQKVTPEQQADEKYFGVTKKKWSDRPVNISGSPNAMSMSDSSIVEQQRKEAQDEITAGRRSTQEFNGNVKPAVKFAFENADKFGITPGVGMFSNVFTSTDEAKERDINIKKINEALQDQGLLAKGQTGSAMGNVIAGGIGAAASKIPGGYGPVLSAAAGTIGASLGKADQIKVDSPPALVRQAAVKLSVANALRERMVRDLDRYAKMQDGDISDYTDTKAYKDLVDMKKTIPYILPDGSTQLVDSVDHKTRTALKNAGAKPYDDFIGGVKSAKRESSGAVGGQ